MQELAGTGSVTRVALGLNGCWSARTCQVAIRILRAMAALAGLALPWRRLMSVCAAGLGANAGAAHVIKARYGPAWPTRGPVRRAGAISDRRRDVE
jgi:hypothetical protein